MSHDRILVVEDEGLVALNLEEKLDSMGYRCVGIAGNGPEALAKSRELRPDLVLMDVKLPGAFDGIQAGKQIHENLGIPVVYLTAFADLETVQRAKGASPYGYLVKPPSDEMLRSVIEIGLHRFHLENRLKQSQQDFRNLFDVSPVGCLLTQENGEVIRMNPTARRIFGCAEGELLGAKFWELFVLEDRDAAKAMQTALFSGTKQEEAELRARRWSGSTLWVGCRFSIVHQLSSGKRMGFVTVADISVKKEAELVLKDEVSRLVERNIKLEQFAAVASHDLRAPARNSGLYIKLLEREYGDRLDSRGREFMQFALAESKRMIDLVDDLLEFSKVSHAPSELVQVSLMKVVRDSLAILAPDIEEKRATIEYGILPTVMGNEIQLRRLFMNLFGNSMKFCRKKPMVDVTLRSSEETEIVVAVADNGVGIPEEERATVFEIFNRGSNSQEFLGTGIGLASCKAIMRNHQGKIWVESTQGKGSVFFLSFPRVGEQGKGGVGK